MRYFMLLMQYNVFTIRGKLHLRIQNCRHVVYTAGSLCNSFTIVQWIYLGCKAAFTDTANDLIHITIQGGFLYKAVTKEISLHFFSYVIFAPSPPFAIKIWCAHALTANQAWHFTDYPWLPVHSYVDHKWSTSCSVSLFMTAQHAS
jgi:hypothetical protein